MFLIGAIKPMVEKNFKTCFILYVRDWLGKVSWLRAYKIKPFLFLYVVGFLAATKTLHKRKEKIYYCVFNIIIFWSQYPFFSIMSDIIVNHNLYVMNKVFVSQYFLFTKAHNSYQRLIIFLRLKFMFFLFSHSFNNQSWQNFYEW